MCPASDVQEITGKGLILAELVASRNTHAPCVLDFCVFSLHECAMLRDDVLLSSKLLDTTGS